MGTVGDLRTGVVVVKLAKCTGGGTNP
jgi:hypothetical protein